MSTHLLERLKKQRCQERPLYTTITVDDVSNLKVSQIDETQVHVELETTNPSMKLFIYPGEAVSFLANPLDRDEIGIAKINTKSYDIDIPKSKDQSNKRKVTVFVLDNSKESSVAVYELSN